MTFIDINQLTKKAEINLKLMSAHLWTLYGYSLDENCNNKQTWETCCLSCGSAKGAHSH